MPKTTIANIAQTSIVTAFTIAAALIWKDVIVEFIDLVLPQQEALLYKFIAAVLATIFVVVAIILIMQTESEAEVVIKKIRETEKKSFKKKKRV